jgi:hypothetical protein
VSAGISIGDLYMTDASASSAGNSVTFTLEYRTYGPTLASAGTAVLVAGSNTAAGTLTG